MTHTFFFSSTETEQGIRDGWPCVRSYSKRVRARGALDPRMEHLLAKAKKKMGEKIFMVWRRLGEQKHAAAACVCVCVCGAWGIYVW